MALSADKVRTYELAGDLEVMNDLPMASEATVFEGSAVGLSSGTARALQGGDAFAGFAYRKAVQANGDVARVRERGFVVLTVTGADGADNRDATVYATDDDTFTLSSTGGSAVGKVHRWITGTTNVVYFESVAQRSV